MLDLDKLSYRAYGNLLIVILLGASALMNLFPVSFKGLVLILK